MAIGLDKKKDEATIKNRMKGAVNLVRISAGSNPFGAKTAAEPEPEPEPEAQPAGGGGGGVIMADSVMVVPGRLGGRRPELAVAHPADGGARPSRPQSSTLQIAREKFRELQAELLQQRSATRVNPETGATDEEPEEGADEAGDTLAPLPGESAALPMLPLGRRFDLLEELSVAAHFYRDVQRCFWESPHMFRFLVDELNEYAWLSVGRKPGPQLEERSAETHGDRLQHLVLVLELLKNVFVSVPLCLAPGLHYSKDSSDNRADRRASSKSASRSSSPRCASQCSRSSCGCSAAAARSRARRGWT